jgi:CheY-like chemotaxis protein
MQNPTLVIVEDDALMAEALMGFVEELGYGVLTTADTEESAVKAVRDLKPDVVLMDVRLKDGNGLAAANTVRRSSRVPIIFCTSYAGNEAVEYAVQALGNATLIGKPFDESELANLLSKAVNDTQGKVIAPPSARLGWKRTARRRRRPRLL